MSLPIQSTGAILSAVRSATQAARDLPAAIGFGKLIEHGQPQVVDVPALLEKTVDAIRHRLAKSGIAANPPIRLSVQENGRLQIARDTSGRDHPRAAEIELLLGSDDDLRQSVTRLQAAGGPAELEIGDLPPQSDSTRSGLTHPLELDNIKSSPGGYPNW